MVTFLFLLGTILLFVKNTYAACAAREYPDGASGCLRKKSRLSKLVSVGAVLVLLIPLAQHVHQDELSN
jgi:hypothetical protein